MLKISSLKVRSMDIDYLDVHWSIDTTYEDVNNYQFYVERSEAEFGPYVRIAGPAVNKFSFRDSTLKGRHAFYRHYYYRIVVEKRDGSESATYPKDGGVRMAAPPDLVAIEMARQRKLRISEFGGREVWVYPKKKSGQVCGCVDRATMRKMVSNCRTCFDTGFVGGYHTPVKVSAIVVSPDEGAPLTPFGRIESEDTIGLFYNYPELFQGDIIIEVENIRWRVGERINKYKKGRALVWQRAVLHRVPPSDVEYHIPVVLPEADLRDFTASPDRNFTNPQNITETMTVEDKV